MTGLPWIRSIPVILSAGENPMEFPMAILTYAWAMACFWETPLMSLKRPDSTKRLARRCSNSKRCVWKLMISGSENLDNSSLMLLFSPRIVHVQPRLRVRFDRVLLLNVTAGREANSFGNHPALPELRCEFRLRLIKQLLGLRFEFAPLHVFARQWAKRSVLLVI